MTAALSRDEIGRAARDEPRGGDPITDHDEGERAAVLAEMGAAAPDPAETARRERYAATTRVIAAAEARRWPRLAPDPQQMRVHVEHLFGDAAEGSVELCWLDRDNHKLQHAHLYDLDDLDTLVEHAVTLNSRTDVNVYIGAALRRRDAPRSKRANDGHFLALPAVYADFDDLGAAEQAGRICRERNCRPTVTVVTGRIPHLRCQVYFQLLEPERDPLAAQQQNRAVALALGGDTTVANPGRVLRLAGSIAWPPYWNPSKPGRVVERTDLHVTNPPRRYYPGELAKAFPPAAASHRYAPGSTAQPQAPGDTTALIARICTGSGGWHRDVLRLVAHWVVARAWSDGEIMIAAAGLTLPGFTVEETRAELAQMIAGARAKWDRPDQPHILGEAPDLSTKPVAYFRAAVEGELSRLRDAVPEHRLAVLGRAAGALVRFVAAGRIDPADLQICLLRAAAMSGIDAASAAASIAAGMNARGVG